MFFKIQYSDEDKSVLAHLVYEKGMATCTEFDSAQFYEKEPLTNRDVYQSDLYCVLPQEDVEIKQRIYLVSLECYQTRQTWPEGVYCALHCHFPLDDKDPYIQRLTEPKVSAVLLNGVEIRAGRDYLVEGDSGTRFPVHVQSLDFEAKEAKVLRWKSCLSRGSLRGRKPSPAKVYLVPGTLDWPINLFVEELEILDRFRWNRLPEDQKQCFYYK